jgi:hypothetical protein
MPAPWQQSVATPWQQFVACIQTFTAFTTINKLLRPNSDQLAYA